MVSIIIPTYKDWNRLELCLKALDSQSYPKIFFEVIVVNNDMNDEVPEKLKIFANVVFINESKSGSYAARNAGIRKAKGDIIGFTDSDCIPHQDWIKNAVGYLNENQLCSRVAGKIAILKDSSISSVVMLYNEIYSFPQQAVVKYGGSMTANLFTYKTLFDQVSYFDENVLSYGDLQWGSLVTKAGFSLEYVNSVIVFHPPRSLKELVIKEKRLGGGSIILHDKTRSNWINVLKFFYYLRPRTRSILLMFSLRKKLTIKAIILIPLLRYYLNVNRKFEMLRVQLGKKPNRA